MSPFILENTYPPLMSSVAMKEARYNKEQDWQLKETRSMLAPSTTLLKHKGGLALGFRFFPYVT